mgnify:CR=1 FL=1
MRETLFRGKRTYNGEWVEGYYCRAFRWTGDEEPQPAIQESGCFMFRLVDPSTIGQYTGLTDKNGEEIFEGDIVEGPDFDEEDGYGVIEWDEESARFTISGNGLTVDFDNYWGRDFMVIGNVTDNPELLEVQDG